MAKWTLPDTLTPGQPTGELKRRMDEHRREQEEALVKAALERAAVVMGEYHWNRYRTKEQGGDLSYPAVFTSHTHQAVQEILHALAKDPAAVAQIIEEAKGKG